LKINQDLCIDCGECEAYCPVEAIKRVGGNSNYIDQELCVECGVCYNSKICAVDAIEREELQWPRILRSVFSDVISPNKPTGIPGRGTEEMKTNDVTLRYKPGRVGIGLEFGRPGVGAYLRDVEKMAMALAGKGIPFEKDNPMYKIMQDPSTGKFMPEVLNERVLSAIIEIELPLSRLKEVLQAIVGAESQIDTVFSLSVMSIMEGGNVPRVMEIMREVGLKPYPNGKTNVGLGRPRKELN